MFEDAAMNWPQALVGAFACLAPYRVLHDQVGMLPLVLCFTLPKQASTPSECSFPALSTLTNLTSSEYSTNHHLSSKQGPPLNASPGILRVDPDLSWLLFSGFGAFLRAFLASQ